MFCHEWNIFGKACTWRISLNVLQEICLKESEIVLCGGTESMSQAPYAVRNIRFGTRFGTDLKVCLQKTGIICFFVFFKKTKYYILAFWVENNSIYHNKVKLFSSVVQQKSLHTKFSCRSQFICCHSYLWLRVKKAKLVMLLKNSITLLF